MTALAVTLFALAPPADQEVLLLDFTAPYCGPCKTIKPRIDALSREGYPIRQVDISREPSLARRFRISFVPTFVLLVDGKEVQRLEGTDRVGELKGMLDKALRPIRQRQAEERRKAEAEAERQRKEALAAKRKAEEAEKERLRLAQLEEQRRRRAAEEAKSPRTSWLDKVRGLRREPEPPVIRGKDPDKLIFEPGISPRRASVRIHVTYDGKVQSGSGTVIYNNAGDSLILTCAHIMDQAGDDAEVKVDVFSEQEFQTFVGRIVDHDIESDVGLIVISPNTELPTARLAPPAMELKADSTVVSIGCNNGRTPTREVTRINAVNRYLGPDNIECDKAPASGRSGGGLFDRTGLLVGVCSAADRKGNHGLYAGHKAVHAMLKEHDLADVVLRTELAENPRPQNVPEADAESGGTRFAEGRGATREDFTPADAVRSPAAPNPAENVASGNSVEAPAAGAATGRREDIAGLLDELGGDAEVTCVIRPRDPRKRSQVVIIHRASSNFVSWLQGELDSQPQPTSFVQPLTAFADAGSDSHSTRFTPSASTTLRQAAAAAAPVADAPQQPTRYRRSAASRLATH